MIISKFTYQYTIHSQIHLFALFCYDFIHWYRWLVHVKKMVSTEWLESVYDAPFAHFACSKTVGFNFLERSRMSKLISV